MAIPRFKQQAGYALILMVLGLMGVGGIVMAGFTQGAKKQVDHQKYLHNKRVLEEAKQALLQFAYNYPETNQLGPGRLPCADTDNDGTPNPLFGLCTQLGRLPWNQQNLNLYDIRDADGQRLWYAVSSNFATQTAGTVNSNSFGTITIRDQMGNFIYDASGGGDGVAAVIIAPGAATARNGVAQDRSIANGDDPFDTTADTDPGIVNPVNYLDQLFGIEDNAVFGQGTANGFVLGRVDDLAAGSILVNDQIAIITAEEVIEVAQRATLQTYQTAINDYRDNIRIGAPGFDAYPWLDDYATTDLTVYDADIGTRLGRVPSLFANYFAPTPGNPPAPVRSITSDVEMTGIQTLTVNGFVVPHPSDIGVISANAQIEFDNNGDLIITPVANGVTIDRYYWDERGTPDGWQECLPVVEGNEQDCNQDLANPGVPDSSVVPNVLETRVVRVRYVNNLTAGTPFTRALAGSAGTDPVYQAPEPASHARIALEYSEIFSDAIGVEYQYDDFYLSTFDDIESGGLNYRLQVTYYPVLPEWTLTNGWHDSMQMAYAAGFQPGPPAGPPGSWSCTTGVDCLSVSNIGGIVDNKIMVLTLAADHNFIDEDADGFIDDLVDIFDVENDDADDDFDNRAGNDQILVVR
jgi:hypothetical protein